MSLQVRARTSVDIFSANLSDLIALPDPEAAESLNTRMAALDEIHRIHERSYAERGIIAREFERRELWKHLEDPDTGTPFANFTAWMSCGDFLGCRRTNFYAKKDIDMLQDVPPEKLIDVPTGNIKTLIKLSTAVRRDESVLEAARTMKPEKFLEKMEAEHPYQHIEATRTLRINLGRSQKKTFEETIAYALEHGIAGTREEAVERMAETARNQWELEQELREMPAEDAAQPAQDGKE